MNTRGNAQVCHEWHAQEQKAQTELQADLESLAAEENARKSGVCVNALLDKRHAVESDGVALATVGTLRNPSSASAAAPCTTDQGDTPVTARVPPASETTASSGLAALKEAAAAPATQRAAAPHVPPAAAVVTNEIGPMVFTAPLDASPCKGAAPAELPFEERTLEQVLHYAGAGLRTKKMATGGAVMGKTDASNQNEIIMVPIAMIVLSQKAPQQRPPTYVSLKQNYL
jgi:hypothetical protein